MSTKILGHNKLRFTLNSLAANSKLPNALILSGPESIGKYLVAQELTEYLTCLNRPAHTLDDSNFGGCKTCRNCSLLASSNYPDLKFIDCQLESDRDINRLRTILNGMLMESFSGSARILLIRDLELFSIAAANLLLKAIEESRGNSFFILTSNNINRIPNTVRSRCQCYNFGMLDPETLTTICSTLINTRDLKSNEFESLDWAISGTVSGALQSIKNKAELEKIKALYDELESGSTTAAFKLANLVHEQKQDSQYLVRAMIELTHQRLTQSHLKSRPWALLLENLQTAERLINERHLNSQYVLANIFINFSQQVTCRNSTTETEKCLNDIIQDAI